MIGKEIKGERERGRETNLKKIWKKNEGEEIEVNKNKRREKNNSKRLM